MAVQTTELCAPSYAPCPVQPSSCRPPCAKRTTTAPPTHPTVARLRYSSPCTCVVTNRPNYHHRHHHRRHHHHYRHLASLPPLSTLTPVLVPSCASTPFITNPLPCCRPKPLSPMVIPRRQRSPSPLASSSQNDSHWLNTSRASRPWDSQLPRLKPATPVVPFTVSDRKQLFEAVQPPSRESNPLNSFLLSASSSDPSAHHHQHDHQSEEEDHQHHDHGPPFTAFDNNNNTSRLGNRQVQPLALQAPDPPQLIGLPVPAPPLPPLHHHLHMSNLNDDSDGLHDPHTSSGSSNRPSSLTVDHPSLQNPPPPPPPPPPPLPRLSEFDIGGVSSTTGGHASKRYSVRGSRRSVRQSVRIPSNANPPPPPVIESSHPSPGSNALPSVPRPDQLDLLPDSSSFLDFNDDHRLNPVSGTTTGASSSHPTTESAGGGGGGDGGEPTSFDDADSFDTFASLQNNQQEEEERVGGHDDPSFNAPTPPSETTHDKSGFLSPSFHETTPNSKPAPDTLSFRTTAAAGPADSNDDEDGGLDIPGPIGASPAASRAMRDLQRASITAANELANSIRLMSQQNGEAATTTGADPKKMPPSMSQRAKPSSGQPDAGAARQSTQKFQGQLMLRSRIFRRWNLRYATIINQAYFGPVLLLFRPDSKPLFSSSFALKSSKMIALAHTTVAVQEEPKKHNNGLIYMFSLTTSQRTYTFACNDAKTRNMWVTNLSSPPV